MAHSDGTATGRRRCPRGDEHGTSGAAAGAAVYVGKQLTRAGHAEQRALRLRAPPAASLPRQVEQKQVVGPRALE